jgi:hypothetical protein
LKERSDENTYHPERCGAGYPFANSVDVNSIALWVKKYCEANPSESLVFGAGAFIRAHHLLPLNDTIK